MNHRPRTQLKNVAKVTPKRRKRQEVEMPSILEVIDDEDIQHVARLAAEADDPVNTIGDDWTFDQGVAFIRSCCNLLPDGTPINDLILESFIESLIENGTDPNRALGRAKRLLASQGFPGFDDLKDEGDD